MNKMKEREYARSPNSTGGELAKAVPFAWEEKPGVAKEMHVESNVQAPHYNQINTPSPLRKPPCLQDTLCKLPSFSSAEFQARHGKLLVRKQSLNNLLPFRSNPAPLARKYSLGNLHQLQRQQHHHAALIRLEDDPFSMAIQACIKGHSFQKEPIKLLFHQGNVKCRVEDAAPPPTQRPRSHDRAADFKHLTIRELCTLQAQEEEQLKRLQREPLVVSHTYRRKHKKGPFSILLGCLGCL